MKQTVSFYDVRDALGDLMDLDEPLSRDEIMKCIKNEKWQTFRRSLKGTSTATKLTRLRSYASANPGRCTTVVVRNYINALKRGGQIKP